MTDRETTARVAIVTGAGQGMGRAIADRLASDGFQIAIGDVNSEAANQAASELAAAGASAAGFEVDVASAGSVDAFVAGVAARFGRLDVVVNNAGVLSLAPIEDLPEQEWDRVLSINLKGAFLCTRAAVPLLKQAGWGRIVNIASDAGKRGELYSAHYCASKFGLIGLTQVAALELARTGVTANAVCPTITATAMMKRFGTEMAKVSGDDVEVILGRSVDEIPMGRATSPTDVANTVAFLCSDDAAFLTGQAINVTGGGWMV